MRKIFDIEEFSNTVEECDIVSAMEEIVEWMDELDTESPYERATYSVLSNVLDLLVNHCTYR